VDDIAVLATMDEDLGEIEHAFVQIEGGVVTAVGPGPAREPGLPSARISGTGLIGLPGLVNTHHHLFQSYTRALPAAQDQQLAGWLDAQYPWWERMTAEASYWAALAGLAELAGSGCATSADHHFAIPRTGDGMPAMLAAVAAAARDVGVRVQLYAGAVDPALHPQGSDWVLAAEPQSVLAGMEESVRLLHDPSPRAMTSVGLAPDWLSPGSATLLTGARELARRRGVRLHTHAAQTAGEVTYCRAAYGRTPVERLDELGWLGADVHLAHAVHLTDADMARLAGTGTGVAHCPSSNMRLGAGMARVQDLRSAGVAVGLGVDGSASNDAGNLLAETRQSLLLARLRDSARLRDAGRQPDASRLRDPGRQRDSGRLLHARAALELATAGGADALGRPELGRLRPGASGDLALYAIDGVACAGFENDPVAALVLSGPHRARHLLVNGRPVVADGELVHVAEADVRREHLRMQTELRPAA
jgi:cytosine/adenosine deaminase-related metal-dependent hydrolase